MSTGPEMVDVDPRRTVVVAGSTSMAEIQQFYDRAFARLGQAVESGAVQVEGAAFGLYRSEPTDVVDLEVGFVLAEGGSDDGGAGEGLSWSQLPGGTVARLVHEGSFEDLSRSWGRLMAWIGEQGKAPAGSMWEVYLTEPTPDTDPGALRTELNCPVV